MHDIRRLAILLTVFHLLCGIAQAAIVPEIASVESRFFGHQTGENRDFTNYGRAFADPVVTETGWKDRQVLLADVGGDGLADLVGYDAKTGVVTWADGKEDGTFDLSRTHSEKSRRGGKLLAAGAGQGGGNQTDLILLTPKGAFAVGKHDHFYPVPAGVDLATKQLSTADFNGDWTIDICAYAANGGFSILYGKEFSGPYGASFAKRVTAVVRPPMTGTLVAADFNGDNYGDVAMYDGKVFAFRFGRGNGMFGPTAFELRAKNHRATHLYADFPWPMTERAIPLAGQSDADGTPDIGLYMPSTGQVMIRLASGDPAYDYSVHLVKDGSTYKMWHGGRWRTLDESGNSMPGWDGDHAMYAWSPDGHRWFRKIDGPMFLKGDEEGAHDTWYSNNYLEPEVLKVGGTYYMFWQVEIDPGHITDTGEKAVNQCDRIGLSTSKDGMTWTRKTDRGVVINITDPTVTNLDHQEVIYVPDDADGKPWWLYTFHFIKGSPAGHVRMRSADPTTFDWAKREHVSGMSQIGNQTGYADEAPGGRLFVRITFTGNPEGRRVPTLQLSRDGLNWESAKMDGKVLLLAGSADTRDNKDVLFLGMSTIDGTGKLDYRGDGKFHALYGATTSNGPGQPEIWQSEIGIGEFTIRFKAQ